MNDSLTYFENQSDVVSIHGYIYPLEKKFFVNLLNLWISKFNTYLVEEPNAWTRARILSQNWQMNCREILLDKGICSMHNVFSSFNSEQ